MYYFNKTSEYYYIRNNEEYKERINKIYALIDPRNDKIFYIGCTISPMHVRIAQHFYERSNAKKKEIMDDLLNDGMFPHIKILYKINDKLKARVAEKYLTHFLINNKLDVDLTNYYGKNNINESVNLAR